MRKAAAALFIVLALCAVWLTSETVMLIRTVPVLLQREVQLTRDQLDGHLLSGETQLFAKLDELLDQTAKLRIDANAQLTAFNTQVSTTSSQLDSRLAEAQLMLAKDLDEYRETLVELNSTWTARADEGLRQTGELQARALEREPMIYSRYLAVTGEAMRTLDAARRTAEVAAEAAPRVVRSTEEIAAASALATQNTAELTKNLAVLTTPKPWWARLLGAVSAVKVLVP